MEGFQPIMFHSCLSTEGPEDPAGQRNMSTNCISRIVITTLLRQALLSVGYITVGKLTPL